MKKNLVKAAIITLSAAMLINAAGCANKEGFSGKENVDYPGAEVVLNGKDVYPISCEDTVTYWKPINSDLGTKYENFKDTPIAQYIAKETGIKVEYLQPAVGGGAEQVQLMLASDELPDIVSHAWGSYPGGPQMAIEDDYIYSLNDIIDKFSPALKKVLSENSDWDKQIKSDDGNYYAYPQILERGLLQVCYGPVLRADFLKKVGMEAPETIEEWEKVLRAFKEKIGVEYPYAAGQSSILQTFAPAFGINTDWYRDGETVKYGYAEPGFKELLTLLNKWYKEGLITPDFVSTDTSNVQTDILNGKAGSTIAWAASGMGKMLSASEDNKEFTLTGVQFPAMKKGENAEYSYLTSEILMNKSVAISKNCKNVELAARLLDFGFTEKGHIIYGFGEEGKTHKMVDGYPKYTDIILDNPDDFSISEAIAAYTMNGNEPLVQDTRYIEQYYTQKELKEAQKQWNKTNMFDHTLPQLYVLPEQSDEDSEIMTNVKTYIDEMTFKFIVGEESIDNFDKYMEQLKKFNLDKAISYRQEAYDRYLSR